MTLDNKLGLTDSLELAKMEEKISKTRAKTLFEEQLLDDKAAGTYAMLFLTTFLQYWSDMLESLFTGWICVFLPLSFISATIQLVVGYRENKRDLWVVKRA